MKLWTISYKKVLVEMICLLFILLFVYAAVSKLTDYGKFKAQLGQSPILTDFAGIIAVMVPAIEIAIAVLLVFPSMRRLALYTSYYLMTLFTVYIIAVLNFSSHVPCSCGGILEKLGWIEHIVFNLIFVGLALTGIYLVNDKNMDSKFSFNSLTPKLR
ncbi:MauE/DoxX family redox-associated membrane protein [Sinomicrobium soli]|uniref:MauE/DoxX family redox-associated membrane protein n=1 Tax=Sinomicrobium sp. N-1-3-6 TaxID=2219864 RepID=UPI000DCF0EC6|nr:MauE/DoxX family redox-associated membrane protein [Sinomicrobium sp. N-1-3-6]RAV30413.1 hypothetical protein DN748_02595 [Sinomicrobium sp. N-1-3-6]